MRRDDEPSEPGEDELRDDDDELDEDDSGEEEERSSLPPSKHRLRRKRSPRSVRPWTVADLDTEEDDVETKNDKKPDEEEGFFQRVRRPVFFRARDSWYFEPLVALAIIVLLLVSLFAYTSNWPPIYVVESGSMQHGTADQVGLINAGDLVLVKKVDPSSVIPYVVGEETGYSTYGESGDVILYYPNGDAQATPVIHRAILYLVWNAANDTYSAPSLAPLPCGAGPGLRYSISGRPSGCGTTGLLTTITLYDVGWRGATVSLPLGALGHYSGFITMGDNNTAPGTPPVGEPDQTNGISRLVAGSWIVGVARGMIPWIGAFKLLLDGNAGKVPPQSWQFLALTIAAIVLAGFGVHYLFRVEGIEDPRRRDEEARARAQESGEEKASDDWERVPRGSRWRALREWLAAAPDEDAKSSPAAGKKIKSKEPVRSHSAKRSPASGSRGRPRPAVRKSSGFFHRRSARSPAKDSDEETL